MQVEQFIKGQKRGVSPSRLPNSCVLEFAGRWCGGIVRFCAEWTQSRLGIRRTDHGKGSGVVFAIERCWLGRVKVACGESRGVLGIVEPEAHMKRIRRS